MTSPAVTEIRRFLTGLIEGLVDDVESVAVSEMVGEQHIVFEVRLAKPDIGKVIGRDGAHARAIRLLLTAAGRKHGYACTLSVIDPPRRERGG